MKSRARLFLTCFVALIALAVPGLFLTACTLPKMSAEGNVSCHIHTSELSSVFVYPDDAVSREKLASWLDYSESKYYSHLFFNWIPDITLKLSDGTHVHFHRDFVHFETISFIQRKRSRTAEDEAFYDYLKSIAPKKEK